MRDCPGCNLPLSNDAVCCNSCGWTRTGGDGDPDWWRCTHEDRGQRCARAGSISPSTGGQSKGARHVSGPWYCAQHVPALQRFANGIAVPPPMGFAALRRIVGPRRIDLEAEAERIAIQTEEA